MNDAYTTPSDELDENSRYNRPRLRRIVSWVGLILGLVAGLGIALYYTWVISPLELTNIRPSQLSDQNRARYIAAIALAFDRDSDLDRATTRLISAVQPDEDPFQKSAEIACNLAQSGYVNNSGGVRAVQALKQFYQLQGRTGCADDLVLVADSPDPVVTVVLDTPTPAAPATKTPTMAPSPLPSETPPPVFVPTQAPVQEYVLVNVSTFCRVAERGLIEVFVQDFNGTGIPGEPVRVRWEGGEDIFYTGLKPERSVGFADFEMGDDPNTAYTIEMPDRSEPSSQQLTPAPCTAESGASGVTSYQVVFRQS